MEHLDLADRNGARCHIQYPGRLGSGGDRYRNRVCAQSGLTGARWNDEWRSVCKGETHEAFLGGHHCVVAGNSKVIAVI